MNREMDPDHHRSVLTFVGEKERIAEGALRAIGKAADLIDLNQHKGAHPRIGATDVVPFIPVRNATLEDCLAIAREVGAEAARRFGIPIYLYEAAATRPDRVQLENIRRGQFEGLRQEIESAPDRFPDFGPPRIHPTAGATVIGARNFLIAYNVNLSTADLEIANRIAKAIRFSSGGLRYVKAMGVELKARGLAQVSMNLTDFEQTPIHRVFEMIKREAERYGVAVAGSEIVGLVPQKALELTAEFYLQVEDYRPELVFENRLQTLEAEKKDLSSLPVSDFLKAVASTESVPGGGSVSALAGALAAALGVMVSGFSLKKKELEEHSGLLKELAAKMSSLQAGLQAAVQKDSESYAAVEAAMKLPRTSEEEKKSRQEKLQSALKAAAQVPMEVAQSSLELLQIFRALEPVSHPNLKSDLKTGQSLALAATRGALENVRINLESIEDAEFVAAMTERVGKIEALL